MKSCILSFFIIMIISLIPACDDLDEYREEVDEKYQAYLVSQISELEGTWGRCDDDTNLMTYFASNSRKTEITYNLGFRRVLVTYYDTFGCSGTVMCRIGRTQEYVLDGYNNALLVYKKRVYFPGSVVNRIIYQDVASVNAANTNGAFGKNNWKLNTAKSISYWIQVDGTSNLADLMTYYYNGWDLWFRDHYFISGDTLYIYEKNSTDPWINQYPSTAADDVDFDRQ